MPSPNLSGYATQVTVVVINWFNQDIKHLEHSYALPIGNYDNENVSKATINVGSGYSESIQPTLSNNLF